MDVGGGAELRPAGEFGGRRLHERRTLRDRGNDVPNRIGQSMELLSVEKHQRIPVEEQNGIAGGTGQTSVGGGQDQGGRIPAGQRTNPKKGGRNEQRGQALSGHAPCSGPECNHVPNRDRSGSYFGADQKTGLLVPEFGFWGWR